MTVSHFNRATLTAIEEIEVPRPFGMIQTDPMVLGVSTALTFPLFKATKREHLDSFMEDGTLRIGTVMEFAHREAEKRGMGDINEGSRTVTYTGQRASIPIRVQITIVNSYVFCCAKEITLKLLDEWEATACFEICDVGFFSEVAKVMATRARFGILHEVYYGDWDRDPRINKWIDDAWIDHNGLGSDVGVPHPEAFPRIAWLKDEDLAYQREVRAIFEPPSPPRAVQSLLPDLDGERYSAMQADRLTYLKTHGVLPGLKPLFIKVPEARKYLREVLISKITSG